MGNLRKALGRTVRRLREEGGFSQESFADAIGVHRTYMGEIERGETNLSLDVLERLARALQLSVAEMFSVAESERHKH
jgi:transcriptional regulator with XRE-family HTH domain